MAKDMKKLKELSIELNRRLKKKMNELHESMEDLKLRVLYLKFENEALKREKKQLKRYIEKLAEDENE